MKKVFKFSLVVCLICFLNSCSDDYNSNGYMPIYPSPNTTYKATLTGASETPSNPSMATGTANLVYNSTSKTFNITITYSGMTVTDAHIHKGAVGVSGPPVFPLSTFVSPIYYTSIELDATQIADLKANLYYVNLHSAAYPNGEIRGQLIKQTSSGGGGPY